MKPARQFERFLRDKVETVHRYLAREDKRHHVTARYSRMDLRFETLRTRPCNTLVLTKTRDSYVQRQEQFEMDRQLLLELETSLAPSSGPRS